jgi:transcriptional regulator with XRE-family HTH domain
MGEFEELLAPFMGARGSQQELARKLGMTPSGFGRGMKAGTLSVENLLTLARETGLPPSRVLRAGGKPEFADLIEQLYGQASTRVVSEEEWGLIRELRMLPPGKRLAAKDFIDWQVGEVRSQQRSPRMLDKRSGKRKAS